MAERTAFRLDTVEMAMEAQWQVHSVDHIDKFQRGGYAITVHYTPDDDIARAEKLGPNGEYETLEDTSPGKLGVLRYWLTGRLARGVEPSPATGELRVTWGDSDRKAGTTSVHNSVDRPGPVWVVITRRERVPEWRAMWFFGTRELAEEGAQRALATDTDTGNGGKILETAVAEGRAYFK